MVICMSLAISLLNLIELSIRSSIRLSMEIKLCESKANLTTLSLSEVATGLALG
jgi:hypothetical protein